MLDIQSKYISGLFIPFEKHSSYFFLILSVIKLPALNTNNNNLYAGTIFLDLDSNIISCYVENICLLAPIDQERVWFLFAFFL
jgi:hypothetical protein